MCTVSIITPSFNSVDFLAENIDSVIGAQHIVVDGESTDGTDKVLKRYSGQIEFIIESDSGQSEAINKGLKMAKGDIINWINSDDLLLQDSINTVRYYFSEYPELGFIHGKTILFDRNRESIVSGNPENEPDKYFSGMSFPQPSAFFHKRVIDKIGFLDESLHFGMDYDFYIRIALNFPVLSINEVLSKYRLHNSSKTVTSHLKFADEWSLVWNRLVRSLKFPKSVVQSMINLDLTVDSDQVIYPVSKSFLEHELQEYFLYFLYYQIYFKYEGFDFTGCQKILNYLKKNHFSFYQKYDLCSIHRRIRLGPKIIKTARTVFR